MKKSWLFAAFILLLLVLLAGWNHFRPAATVQVVRPSRQTIRAYVEEQAVTELPHDYLISMPIDGWLEPIRLLEGDKVSADMVVARLDREDLRDRVTQAEQRVARLESQIAEARDHRLEENALVEAEATVRAIDETVRAAEANLEATRALLDFASGELQRTQKLSQLSAAAEQEVRQAELEFRKAQAAFQTDSLELAALKTVAAVSYIGPKFIRDYIDRKSFTVIQLSKELDEAKVQLEIERRNLSRAELCSPVDGVVLHRHQTRRQFLAAGTPLLTIGQLHDIEVTAEVLTERATRIEPEDPVEAFGDGMAGEPHPGVVLRVYPAGFTKISSLGVEQQRVKVAIKLAARPAQLGVGFRLYVRIFTDEATNALTLPRTCLFRDVQGKWNVMIVRNGIVEVKTVAVGLTNDDMAQIMDGLAGDEQVVARPSREVESGMRVLAQPR